MNKLLIQKAINQSHPLTLERVFFENKWYLWSEGFKDNRHLWMPSGFLVLIAILAKFS